MIDRIPSWRRICYLARIRATYLFLTIDLSDQYYDAAAGNVPELWGWIVFLASASFSILVVWCASLPRKFKSASNRFWIGSRNCPLSRRRLKARPDTILPTTRRTTSMRSIILRRKMICQSTMKIQQPSLEKSFHLLERATKTASSSLLIRTPSSSYK